MKLESGTITSTSFEVRAIELETGYVKWLIWYLDGVEDGSSGAVSTATESSWVQFDNLDPETSYTVRAEVHEFDASGTFMGSDSITVTTTAELSGSWDIAYEKTISSGSGLYEYNFDLDEYQLARVKIIPKYSGEATFATNGTTDGAYLQLSSSYGFNPENGSALSNILEEKFSRNDDVSIIYELEAGETYYLFISHYNENGYGNIPVEITLPQQSSAEQWQFIYGGDLGIIDNNTNTSATIEKGQVIYFTFISAFPGQITIYSESAIDVIGYLTAQTTLDAVAGEPSPYLVKDDDGAGNRQFKITYGGIETGTTYAIFVRGYDLDVSGVVTIFVEPPDGTTVGERPAKYYWTSNVTQGKKFQITADEWCALLDNINAVRVYRGLPEIQIGSSEGYFTYPNKGDNILALYYNQALNGITGILGTGYDDNKVSSKQPITAAKLILLQDMINDIE